MRHIRAKLQYILGVAALLGGVAGLLFAGPHTPVHAGNERIITIHHDGQEQTIATDATTVAEVLSRTRVALGGYDTVEPALDTRLIAQNYNVNVYRARPVTIVDGVQRYHVMTPHTSAKKIAQSAGLQIYDEDVVDMQRIDDFVAENGVGLKLTIARSVPVKMSLYGKMVDARTMATTVGGFLREKQITLGKDDGVAPAADAPIAAGLTVAVYRNGVQVVNEEQDVVFGTEQIQDADRDIGYRQVKQAGTKGRKLVTYQIELRDGKEIGRKEIQSVVTVQPKKQIEIVGTKRAQFSGTLEEAFAKLRACEAGGNYARVSSNGLYRGAYQYDISTWANYQGYKYPNEAPPAVQDQKAYETYKRRGWSPWPACSRKLGLQ